MHVHIDISIIIHISIQVDTIRFPADIHFGIRSEVLFREQNVSKQGAVFTVVVFSLGMKV